MYAPGDKQASHTAAAACPVPVPAIVTMLSGLYIPAQGSWPTY
ncbi:MAG: hypothetical protein OXC42_01560 [Gammaproteobacteria bacterium]|nr:hypothetical protein [Gammaproteobacteria bacterium]